MFDQKYLLLPMLPPNGKDGSYVVGCGLPGEYPAGTQTHCAIYRGAIAAVVPVGTNNSGTLLEGSYVYLGSGQTIRVLCDVQSVLDLLESDTATSLRGAS